MLEKKNRNKLYKVLDKYYFDQIENNTKLQIASNNFFEVNNLLGDSKKISDDENELLNENLYKTILFVLEVVSTCPYIEIKNKRSKSNE